MNHNAGDLARRLAENAEAVCRHYLSSGRRSGRWWTVGDVHNTPGGSLFVRLKGPLSGPNRAGKWMDAASLEHGDLLDLILHNRDCRTLAEAMAEARRFLSECPPLPPEDHFSRSGRSRSLTGLARRLFAGASPIPGTWAEAYLRARDIWAADVPALRYHPRTVYRAYEKAPRLVLPALLAAITSLDGRIVSVHRTWLDPVLPRVANVRSPKRTLGEFRGNAVRFGEAFDVLVAGEGIETTLSLKAACPELPMAAATSAPHLAALLLPATLRRLWIAHDRGRVGVRAAARLRERAEAQAVAVRLLTPLADDFNSDLRRLGQVAFALRVRTLLGDELLRLREPVEAALCDPWALL